MLVLQSWVWRVLVTFLALASASVVAAACSGLTERSTYMRASKLSFFAAGAVTALVLGGGTAFAATGGNFILGRANGATTTTTLTNSAGTALAINSMAGTPTLRVGNTVRIPSLNADMVDGLHAGSFARTTGQTGSFNFAGQTVDSDGNGRTDTIVASGACPVGTQLTGGGISDFTQTGITVMNAPDVDPESWLVAVSVDEAVAENPADVTASVVCYKPTGPIAGAFGVAPRQLDAASELSAKTLSRLAVKAASRN
jgi:hypothetical protein